MLILSTRTMEVHFLHH
uniref:Uncharacterized protein n=1 Tax=Arundo donax TaxID=35708 RepID=A0A0A9ASW9_ARUDO